MTSRCFGLQRIPRSADRGATCQAHGRSDLRVIVSGRHICVEARDRGPAPRWRSPWCVDPPKLNSQGTRKVTDRWWMYSSLHEITEVQQTTARLLGSCLSPKPSTHPVWIYAMDSREVGSTAVRINTSVVFAPPKALRLSNSPSINQPTCQALSLSLALHQVVNNHICLPCWVLTSPSMSPARHGRVSLLDCLRRSLVFSMGEWKSYVQMDPIQQRTNDDFTATIPRLSPVCNR